MLILTKMYQISIFATSYFYILQKNDEYRIKIKCTNKREIIRKNAYFDKNVSNKHITIYLFILYLHSQNSKSEFNEVK